MLSGRVVDLRGEPVPIAKVWVVAGNDRDEQIAHSMADALGYFRMGGVPKANSYRLRATADGKSIGSDYLDSDAERGRIVVHDAATVRGVLRNANGDPVANTIVEAHALHFAFGSKVSGETDENGRFALQRVPLGHTQIGAVVIGEGLAEVRYRVAGEDEIELRSAKGETVSLHITVEGMPKDDAPEVAVSLWPYRRGRLQNLPPPWREPRFRGDEWQADGLPDWEYRVALLAAGFEFRPDRTIVGPGKGPHRLKFTATERENEILACPAIVRDKQGRPVEGVPFVLQKMGGGPHVTAVSDADGKMTFQVPLADGTEAYVYSTHDDYVIEQPKREGMEGLTDRRFLEYHEFFVDPADTVELCVVPATAVTGTVTHADGRPAAFVGVQLQDTRPGFREWPLWSTFCRATTDRQGRFRFGRLHHSTDSVRCIIEGRDGNARSAEFSIADEGAQVTVPAMQLSAPAMVEGIVRDQNQQPVAGICVFLGDWDMEANTQRSGGITEVITDRKGRFRFVGVPVGGATLQLVPDRDRWPPPWQREFGPFAVEPGQTYTFEFVEQD